MKNSFKKRMGKNKILITKNFLKFLSLLNFFFFFFLRKFSLVDKCEEATSFGPRY